MKHLVWVVALLSGAVLGFELSLMRLLLVASWHHFAFLVISIALLGFGASGTALSLARGRLLPHRDTVLLTLTLATALSIPICSSLAQLVPVEARFVPLLMWKQLALWTLYWILLGIPFFFGAAAIGLALMTAHKEISVVYGANLAGSGFGAVLAPMVMLVLSPSWLPLFWGCLSLVAVFGIAGVSATLRVGGVAASLLFLSGWVVLDPPEVRIDPYKFLAHVERLERQGSAERVAEVYGPRGLVQVYRGDVFHDIPFLSVGVTPPPIHALTIDGHWAGSVLQVSEANEARVVDKTLMSFPYSLARSSPNVLLLGEKSGLNVWLAVRQGAESTAVVQANGDLFDLLRGRLRSQGGAVFDRPNVDVVAMDPRHYVEATARQFDLIQLALLESSAAGSGGIEGLGQNHLITVQGLSACLRRLNPEGLLSVCRGIQTPPRDSLKILATLVSALGAIGITEPERHVVIVRDYLAVCTIVKLSPWDETQVAEIRRRVREQELTPVWFSGVTADELNQPDELSGPADSVGDWYYYGAQKIFSSEADSFIEKWLFEIRPPTDDRPFFLDFCKLRSIGPLKDAFGELWMTRAELAFLFVVAALTGVLVVGAALTIFPLMCRRSIRCHQGKGATAAYFAAIGLAYLLLEMMALSRLSLLIGDSLYAASVTISSFLILSGVGSLLARRMVRGARGLRGIVVCLVIVGAVHVLWFGELAAQAGQFHFLSRSALAVLAIAPLAILMGFPMPVALMRLDRGATELIPWAWGVNGFASVMAAPLATILAMSWGFRVAGVTALLLYLLTIWFYVRLPGHEAGGG